MSIQNIISKRKTLKVLSNMPQPIKPSENLISDINEMIVAAGKAPFHYPANKEALTSTKLSSVAPWRFYILDTKTCRDLATYYQKNNIDGGKIVQMLHTASALIQATWIPEPMENDELTMSQKNIEHIAATSAAIQNMLLVATEKKYHSYWSSGGTLRNDVFKTLLDIPKTEQLLGSIFLFTEDDLPNTQQIKGAWRNKQGNTEDFSSFVTI